MSLQWSALSGATSYRVERSTDGSNYSVIAASVAGTTYADNTVSPMTEYYYRVFAANANPIVRVETSLTCRAKAGKPASICP